MHDLATTIVILVSDLDDLEASSVVPPQMNSIVQADRKESVVVLARESLDGG